MNTGKTFKPCAAKANSSGGFGLVAIIIVLAMLGIAGGVGVLFVSQIQEIRGDRLSRDEMTELKEAILGKKNLFVGEGRAEFGYAGTMGKVPSSLEDLYKKGSQPSLSFSSSKGIAAGWKGPYITPVVIENLDSLKKDSFGNDYEYTGAEFTRADGKAVSARIRSLGPDSTLDSAITAAVSGDDRDVDILRSEVFSTASGFVVDSGGVGQGDITVFLNKPVDGVATTVTTVTSSDPSDKGAYSFSDIPLGLRTFNVSGGLGVVTGTAVSGGNKITLKVRNNGNTDITVTSIKAVYDITAFYELIKLGGVVKFNYNSGTRGASGDTKTFSGVTILGSAGAADIKVERVEKSTHKLPDFPNIVLGDQGNDLLIEYLDFKDAQTGSADDVNMTGATVTLTFSDGSEVTFTTAP